MKWLIAAITWMVKTSRIKMGVPYRAWHGPSQGPRGNLNL
jgi:hypothetical protein